MSTTEYTEEEKEKLVGMFESLNVKPKFADTEELELWMQEYLLSKGKARARTDPDEHAKPTHHEVTSHVLRQPKIATFSGNDDKGVSFETWSYEVSTLLREKTYSGREIETAAKKSLRGSASDVVRRLGVDADIKLILYKLRCLYGVVEDSDCLLKQFYGATQKSDESVASWACRLEEMLDRANQQEQIRGKSMGDMLLNRFWSGLRTRLKEAARSKVEHIHDYERLLVEVRRIESEDQVAKDVTKGKVNVMAVPTDGQQVGDDESLKCMMAKMNGRLDDMEQTMKSMKSGYTGTKPSSSSDGNRKEENNHSIFTGQHRGRGRGRDGNWNPGYRGNSSSHGYRGNNSSHGYRDRSSAHAFQQGSWNSHSNSRPWNDNNSRSWNRPNTQNHYGLNSDSSTNSWQNRNPTTGNQPTPNEQQRQEIICHRCRQPGHIAIGCRADLDSLPLNRQESV